MELFFEIHGFLVDALEMALVVLQRKPVSALWGHRRCYQPAASFPD